MINENLAIRLTGEIGRLVSERNDARARCQALEREKRELSCDLLTAHRETMEHAGRIIELEREVKALRDGIEAAHETALADTKRDEILDAIDRARGAKP